MAEKNVAELLRAPFPSNEIEWRVGSTFKDRQSGTMLAYVSARGIQNRLDEVFGVEGWKDSFETCSKGVICTLTCTFDGKTIVKSDGAEFTEQASPLKGAISGALKRAAAQLGIGRYLYELDAPRVDLHNGRFYGKITLPDWALPENERSGNLETKVEYDNRQSYGSSSTYQKTVDTANAPEDIQKLLDMVVSDGSMNNGKKLSEVSMKSLTWMKFNSNDTVLKDAAAKVLDFKFPRK